MAGIIKGKKCDRKYKAGQSLKYKNNIVYIYICIYIVRISGNRNKSFLSWFSFYLLYFTPTKYQ